MGLGTTITTPAYDHDRVVAVVTEHAASLLRIARAHSLCADDAQDAYQRALEIYLQRFGEVDHATAGSWLRTVCKHEAMRIREQRGRLVGAEEVAWDAQPSVEAIDPGEHASSLERVARAAEALQGCKRDEATAILLKADGSSYAEIGALTGWSRTKVNRALAEGRARFLRRYADIDSGASCASWTPVLSTIVDGEASPEDFARLRPHLRHCAGCRTTLKALYEAEPALGSLVPAGLFATAVTGLGDRLVRLHTLFEAVTSTKAAAVLASTAAVAAGGAAAADQVREASVRPEPVAALVRPAEVRAVAARPAAVRRNVPSPVTARDTSAHAPVRSVTRVRTAPRRSDRMPTPTVTELAFEVRTPRRTAKDRRLGAAAEQATQASATGPRARTNAEFGFEG